MLFQVNGKKEMKQKRGVLCIKGQKLDPPVLTVGRMSL